MGHPPLNIEVTKKDQHELRRLLKGGVQLGIEFEAIADALGQFSGGEWRATPQEGS